MHVYVLYINSVESTHTVDGKSMGEIKEKKYKNVRKINYYSFFSWLLKQFGFNSRFCKHQNTTRVGKLVLKKHIITWIPEFACCVDNSWFSI